MIESSGLNFNEIGILFVSSEAEESSVCNRFDKSTINILMLVENELSQLANKTHACVN